nr:MAG TPA: tail protein [Caudoviricetes sp.]
MGHVTVVGGCRAKAPSTGILASTLPVGSTVKLMEGGTAVEYLVVNQGKPSGSSLYDDSCDGTWLLRKDIHSNRQWNTSEVNKYESSAINAWLNGDYFNTLGSTEQAVIKQVKIPYFKNGGYGGPEQSGANGLLCKIFLLSGYEVGWTTSDNQYFPQDGAKLSYFTASSGGNSKRIAYLNGSATNWWLRSPGVSFPSAVWYVSTNGSSNSYSASGLGGIRPALILPPTAKFDAATMLLKG